jgi:hypothetical protein
MLDFGLYLTSTMFVGLAVLYRLGKKRTKIVSRENQNMQPLTGTSAWRNSLPPASEVHVAFIMQIAKERKESPTRSAT